MSPARDRPSALDPERLASGCETHRTRRSGPGGQNRNRVETASVLVHRQSGNLAEATGRRSQGENLGAALFRLRLNRALEVRRPVGHDEPPTPLWASRFRVGRIAVPPCRTQN